MDKTFDLRNSLHHIIPTRQKWKGQGWNNTRADPLLQERARAEYARSRGAQHNVQLGGFRILRIQRASAAKMVSGA